MENRKLLLVGGVILGLLLLGGAVFFFWRQREPASVAREAPRAGRREPLVVPPSAEETTYEAYQTADGGLSFDYPAAWTRTEIKNLETVLPKSLIDEYQLTMPLLLSDPRGAQISLSIYHFEQGQSLDEIMNALKAELVALGQPYNEISRQRVGDSLVVDSTVDSGSGTTVKVRDILFLIRGDSKDAVYNISFSAREPNWGDYETIFSHIQDSAKLAL